MLLEAVSAVEFRNPIKVQMGIRSFAIFPVEYFSISNLVRARMCLFSTPFYSSESSLPFPQPLFLRIQHELL